jgi:NAD(P)H-hydrate epimerase
VTAAEAARLDAAVRDGFLVPSLLLMEGAAQGIWKAAQSILAGLPEGGRDLPIVALAGPGNNGGDALAVLRLARFSGRRALTAVITGDRQGELPALHLAALRALGVAVLSWPADAPLVEAALCGAVLVLDGIAGTGLKGGLREPAAGLVALANACPAPVLAVDLPSGLGEGYLPGLPIVQAEWTASIEPRKACLHFPAARESAGSILSVEGVFPADAEVHAAAVLLEDSDLAALAPGVAGSAHKGSRGRLGLFAGSPGMVGAAGLAASGAAAGGAGLITLLADEAIHPGLSLASGPATLSHAIIKALPAAASDIDSSRFDAALVGPGWGASAAKSAALAALLERGLPLVVDADGLRALAPLLQGGRPGTGPLILTPHPGEFEALSGLSASAALANPPSVLPPLAASWNAVIVLKSHVTWIAAPDGRLAVWDGLEPGLATAGSGDVLAGLAGAFLASLAASSRGGNIGAEAAYRAARAAVIAHGLSGRRARARSGWFQADAIATEAALLLGGIGAPAP